MSRTSTFVWLFLVVLISYCSSNAVAQEQQQQQQQMQQSRRMMMGGYREADVKEERVVGAAHFALKTMLAMSDNKPSYAFLTTTTDLSTDDLQVVVLEASQQVVAGMNYRLTVGLQQKNNDGCVGGFECTVYDHFGDLSVTQWGDEVSCDEVRGMMQQQQQKETTAEEETSDP